MLRITSIGGLVMTLVSAGLPQATDQVRTATGLVEGIKGAITGVREFRGIPYAAPPVGPLRWKAPQPATSWTGVRKSDQFGNRCIQTNPFGDMVWRSAAESEDCLYLSVWTPATSAGARLPVMFWIHGGGFFSGASDEGRHEGATLASKGVVVVEINYRLGLMGFLSHPELTAESPTKTSGNYGLLDQIAALQWVKTNIAAFGGDPNLVTIFGESAGSLSVSALMASPLARGLFHRAIGQSGGYFADTLPLLPPAAAEKLGADLAASVGATSLAALRATAPADLVKTVGRASTRYVPTIDGHFLPDTPLNIYAAGRQARVPLLAGWNSAEIKAPPITADAFTAQVKKQFGNDAEMALKLYSAGSDAEARRSATAVASDNFMGYNTWKWIEAHAATGGSPVYRYLFDQIVPTVKGDPAPDDPGAAHATDIEFVFSTLETRKVTWRPVDRQVSELMVAWWTNFAKTGNPNGPGLPAWPAFGADGKREVMRINATSKAEPEQHRDRYLFHDARRK
jgi:para-nitrobenzyl esterase